MVNNIKILVTGSRGLIGGRLSDYLIFKKFTVLKVSRSSKKEFKQIKWNSQNDLLKLCKKVDIIINCAGLDVHKAVNNKISNKVNAFYPFKLFKAANKSNVKLFIFLSTFHVYNSNKKKIINERCQLKKKDIYTSSKILGERKLLSIKNKKTKLLIIRSCNLFGYPIYKNKNCWKLIINSMIKESLIKKKFTIKSITNSHRNYSSIKNFCVFIKKLIDNYNYLKFNKNVFKINFASDKNLSLIDLVKIVKKKLKLKKNNFIFKYKKLKRVKIINYSSNYFSVFYSRNDKFFNSEIKNTISYIKQNYKIK